MELILMAFFDKLFLMLFDISYYPGVALSICFVDFSGEFPGNSPENFCYKTMQNLVRNTPLSIIFEMKC